MRPVTIARIWLIVALLQPLGCGGPKTVWITGKVVKGEAPYTPPDGQSIGVTFYALDAGKEPYSAEFNPADATFRVPGRDGRGIPPGKYRVAVNRSPKRGTQPPAAAKGKSRTVKPDRDLDYLKGEFGSENSPIVRELMSSCDLTINLDSPGAQ
jgi:hypothetical protein